MANPWFRLYSEFSHDPKVQMMPEAMQRRYVMLLCLRCSNALETLHETEIAFHLRISEADLGETKALFEAKGFIDEHWTLLNWDKRQFVSDSSTPRVRKMRDARKNGVRQNETFPERFGNGLDHIQITDPDKKNVALLSRVPNDPAVELIYQAYPRKVGRPKALVAILAAIQKLGTGKDWPKLSEAEALVFLLNKTREFAHSQAGQAGEFTPHPATWFNAGRYTDDPKEWQRGGDQKGGSNEASRNGRPGAALGLRDLGNDKANRANEALARALAAIDAESGSEEAPGASTSGDEFNEGRAYGRGADAAVLDGSR